MLQGLSGLHNSKHYISNPWWFDPLFLFSNKWNNRYIWQVQAIITLQLHLIQLVSIVIAMIHPDHNGYRVKRFFKNLKSNGWFISVTDVFYQDLGNTIAGSSHLITAVHSSCTSTVSPLLIKWSPLVTPCLLGEFIWEPFNWPKCALY